MTAANDINQTGLNINTTMISAIILAGGQGRRLNHKDKGLIEWKGKKLVQHVIDRIQPQVDEIVINANQNIETYRALGFSVCEDILKNFQGPLAGIQASLPSTSHPLVFICPCDTALLPENLVSKLHDALQKQGVDIVFASCLDRSHYLPVLLKASLGPKLNTYLSGNDRSMKGWYKTLKFCTVSFDNEALAFRNFNQPSDFY